MKPQDLIEPRDGQGQMERSASSLEGDACEIAYDAKVARTAFTSTPIPRETIVGRIASELDHAYAKHGRDKWGRHEFFAILKEEVDELWDGIKRDGPQNETEDEALQVASMVFRYLETGDRYRKPLQDARAATDTVGPGTPAQLPEGAVEQAGEWTAHQTSTPEVWDIYDAENYSVIGTGFITKEQAETITKNRNYSLSSLKAELAEAQQQLLNREGRWEESERFLAASQEREAQAREEIEAQRRMLDEADELLRENNERYKRQLASAVKALEDATNKNA